MSDITRDTAEPQKVAGRRPAPKADGNKMTPARRAAIDAVMEARLRAMLAARDGDLAEKLAPHAPNGNCWLWGVAFRIFLDTRSPRLKGQADGELDRVLARDPQTEGGRALLRCFGLLFRLIYQGARRRGEL